MSARKFTILKYIVQINYFTSKESHVHAFANVQFTDLFFAILSQVPTEFKLGIDWIRCWVSVSSRNVISAWNHKSFFTLTLWAKKLCEPNIMSFFWVFASGDFRFVHIALFCPYCEGFVCNKQVLETINKFFKARWIIGVYNPTVFDDAEAKSGRFLLVI